MAFVYRVSFDLAPAQAEALALGAPLERVIGYLRARLPSLSGFVTARAMQSLGVEGPVEVAFESVWQDWEDLRRHCESDLLEAKVLIEFGSHVTSSALRVRLYREVP